MKYSEILNNVHFKNLAKLIRVPFHSPNWRRKHTNIPFWGMLGNIRKIIDVGTSRQDLLCRLLELLVKLRETDTRISYTEEDLNWLVDQADSKQAFAIFSLLLAYASAKAED
jgi:hypothetical protein